MSNVRRELTADEKKLIINLNNNNSTQQFIAGTLNASQSVLCIEVFWSDGNVEEVWKIYMELADHQSPIVRAIEE